MLAYFVIAPIIIAVILYLLPYERVAKIIAILAQCVMLIASVYVFNLSRVSDVVSVIGHYYGPLGITLRVDSLSAVFLLLSTFVFLIVSIYSYSDKSSRMFWMLLFIWEGSLIGIFLSGDLFNIFVLTEVATLTVTVLIMYYRDKRSMYDGLIYLMINFVVVQFYLLGLGYIYRVVGFMDIEAAAMHIPYIETRQLYLAFAFIMTFVVLKCAMIPLFNWLPKAHSTPGATPAVSAVLSGLHIKSGVYLFLRFTYIFGNIDARTFFLILGLLTAGFGVVMALSQNDIKRILAYSTIAQIGLIIAGLNTGSFYNHMGSLVHSINHAIIKVSLFLCAGMIAEHYGTKKIDEIRGVMKSMPIVGAATVLAIFGMIGMPMFNGSISKYFMVYGIDWRLNIIFILINLGTILIFIKFAAMLGGPGIKKAANDFWKEAPLILLGVMCFVLGVFGEHVILILFGWEANVSISGYIQKTVIFAVSIGVGILIHKYLLSGRAFMKRLREFDMGFREMCAAVGVFFAVLLVSVGFF